MRRTCYHLLAVFAVCLPLFASGLSAWRGQSLRAADSSCPTFWRPLDSGGPAERPASLPRKAVLPQEEEDATRMRPGQDCDPGVSSTIPAHLAPAACPALLPAESHAPRVPLSLCLLTLRI